MTLISSREAVQFLSQAAPKPWAQRLLRWMAFDEDLPAYSTYGKVQAHCSVFDIVASRIRRYNQMLASELEDLIRKEFSKEMAERLVGSKPHDRVHDKSVTWTQDDRRIRLDIGFVLHAGNIDWDAGIVRSSFFSPGLSDLEVYFPKSEIFLASQFEMPTFDAVIEGLSFDLGSIEMLLPATSLAERPGFTAPLREVSPNRGRPTKWAWERAMAFVISQAQLPDGLPTGQGAQARVEEMMRDWFLMETGEAPVTSQIRERAAMIMRELERPKKP